MDKEKEQKKAPKNSGGVLSWIFGFLFLILGFSFIGDTIIGGLLYFMAAALLLPPIRKFIEKKINYQFSRGVLLIIVVIIFIIGAIALPDYGDKNQKQEIAQNNTNQVADKKNNETQNEVDEIETEEYEYLGITNDEGVENYAYIIKSSDLSEETVKIIAEKIKKEKCTEECMIDLYDDEEAFKLDKEYANLKSSDEMTKWKEKNYVFVGDHYVGYLYDNEFLYYPLKDWFYEEQKQKEEIAEEPEQVEEQTSEPEVLSIFESKNEATAIIKENAMEKWGDDYSMVQYEINNQTEAYDWLVKQDKYPEIMAKAKQKWDDDYTMVQYEYNNQVEAYEAL